MTLWIAIVVLTALHLYVIAALSRDTRRWRELRDATAANQDEFQRIIAGLTCASDATIRLAKAADNKSAAYARWEDAYTKDQPALFPASEAADAEFDAALAAYREEMAR